jgi:hypothetical protein
MIKSMMVRNKDEYAVLAMMAHLPRGVKGSDKSTFKFYHNSDGVCILFARVSRSLLTTSPGVKKV